MKQTFFSVLAGIFVGDSTRETAAPKPPKSGPRSVPRLDECDAEIVATAEARLSPKTIANQRVLATEKATADIARLRSQHGDGAKLLIALDEHLCLVSCYLSTLARLADSERSTPAPAPRQRDSVGRARRATERLQQRRATRRAS